MLSRQELSAPQVASFLMDYEDHFSSHNFRCLFWTSAESFIERCLPSEITARSSQLRDYIYRGDVLARVSFWDWIARISKARFSKTDGAGLTVEKVEVDQKKWEGANVLAAATKTRPVCRFKSEHDLHDNIYAVVCHPLEAVIPLIIGPALPRRDRPPVRAKYCRLMLILFKPWRTVEDLRAGYASWPEAFDAFLQSPECPPDAKTVMRNMQAFHECKDSRDEH
ncbi:hypothetical protein FA13DRAFT_1627074, partial [Coprinellus micaceus]